MTLEERPRRGTLVLSHPDPTPPTQTGADGAFSGRPPGGDPPRNTAVGFDRSDDDGETPEDDAFIDPPEGQWSDEYTEAVTDITELLVASATGIVDIRTQGQVWNDAAVGNPHLSRDIEELKILLEDHYDPREFPLPEAGSRNFLINRLATARSNALWSAQGILSTPATEAQRILPGAFNPTVTQPKTMELVSGILDSSINLPSGEVYARRYGRS